MKKIFLFLLAFMLIASQAFAITYYADSTERYADDEGKSYVRVLGHIAFDTSYPGDKTTNKFGEVINPSNIGLSAIDVMTIEPQFVTNVGATGGLVFFKYRATCNAGTGSVTTNCIQGFYPGFGTSYAAGPMVSMPTYDLSALSNVPFMAIGVE